MLNPSFVSYLSRHDGKMYVIAWLPFIIWRMKSLVEFPLFNASLLSFGLGMSSCLTCPDELFHDVGFVSFLVVCSSALSDSLSEECKKSGDADNLFLGLCSILPSSGHCPVSAILPLCQGGFFGQRSGQGI